MQSILAKEALMQRNGIAQRAARWSANHRKAAILGWIAFVVAAMFIGNSIGTKTIADEDSGNGESRVADQVIADSGFPEDASEQVLVQAREGQSTDDPAFRAAVADVEE